MRGNRYYARWIAGAAVLAPLLAIAIPVVAQRSPTSLLPPGFGDSAPQDQAPDQSAQPAGGARGAKVPLSGTAPAPSPSLRLDLSGLTQSETQGEGAMTNTAAAPVEELTPEELAAQQAKYDLPDNARRSLDRIGPLTHETGGVANNAFGSQSGKFLGALMRESRAPFVSRWGSILLRRVLLSATDTPADIDGADWAAERAWLLVRMGEADAARAMVQSVDADKYTPRLSAVAMQAYLASADPAGLCPLYQRATTTSNAQGWRMADAMCASFSGDQGTASAALNLAQRHGTVSGIDYRLTEKIVGAGTNARRSVKIEWDGVDTLTAWRFGLATAANVDIPAPLMSGVGPRVWAWQARAPMLSLVQRLPGVEVATQLGVFSSAALVDFYGELAASDDAPDGFADKAQWLTDAYTGDTETARIAAMHKLWTGSNGTDFLGLLTVARAAAALPVTEADAADVNALIAAMLSAGYDNSAARWAGSAPLSGDAGAEGWALLAVGTPSSVVNVTADRTSSYVDSNGNKGRMLVAGLAGLGRLPWQDAARIAKDAGFSIALRSKWTTAIDAAAQRGEKATVALLAAVGMQVSTWSKMPPEHLYHIIWALHRVGLDPEARMIAAEAITRA
ncbi:MAG: hypothetical protein ABI395_09505 [Sphingobium sp.]